MTISSIDQLNQKIVLDAYPKRIISLVPSQSELLYDLGLKNELIGITKFCIHPSEMSQNTQRVGGTKNIDLKLIDELKPDLIIGNKEENTQSDIHELKKKYNVWMSDVNTLQEALDMIQEIGRITNKEKEATELLNQIHFNYSASGKKIIYLIWNNPMMCVGKNTFIDAMITEGGYENVILDSRYPEISLEEIQKFQPDYLFLSTEPFPFKKEHCEDLQKKLSGVKVLLVDGEMFSWYGSRLIKSKEYFKELLSLTK